MPNSNTSPFSAKINWNSPKAHHKQKVVKFTDADLYSEESESACVLIKPKIKFAKSKTEDHKIF
jgi:hypothetical protein